MPAEQPLAEGDTFANIGVTWRVVEVKPAGVAAWDVWVEPTEG
jgi:hypothetical protein